jgi:molybdate transport system substrate-binding protein
MSSNGILVARAWRALALLVAPLCCGLCGACEAPAAAEGRPLLLAAASMHDVVRAIQRENRTDFRSSFAASSTLARQIAAGVHAEVYVSANRRWMAYLQQKKLLAAKPVVIAHNRLQLVANHRFAQTLAGSANNDRLHRCSFLSRATRIAIADPAHVPAGIYAKQVLKAVGCYRRLRSRFILAVNVRAALRIAEIGEADLAIVYRSDQQTASAKLIPLGLFSARHHLPIAYYAAPLTRSAGAERVMRVLTNRAAKRIFVRHGFSREVLP